MSVLESLILMGFPEERAKEALFETNYAGLDIAIEWLLVTDESQTMTNDKEEVAEVELEQPDLLVRKNSLEEPKAPCEAQEAISIPSEKTANCCQNSRILVRLLDGKTLSKVFNEQTKLEAVRFWIQSHIKTDQFGLMTNFPKKIFTDEDYELSLVQLNLVPSAAVIVTQLEKWTNLKAYHGVDNDNGSRVVEEKRRKEEIEKQLKAKEEESSALERVRKQIADDKTARRQRWPSLYENANQPLEDQLSQNQLLRGLIPRPERSQNGKSNKKLQ